MKRFGCITTLVPVLPCTLLALLSPPLTAAPPAPLTSPWRAIPIQLTQASYDCAPPPPIAPDILMGKGLSKSNLSTAVKQAAYPESEAALHDLTARSVDAADAFRHTGSQASARCAIALLANAAADHAMAGYMASNDTAQEQNIALRSVAIAYLKVRDSGVASAEEQALISAWLEDIAYQERARIETPPCAQQICSAHGHHGIGIVMATMAAAVATNDSKLFKWSVGQYRNAVRQIDDRGMLRYDTHGQYALKFNLLSAACLVQIAEFGETNGVPMYSYDGGRIHLLIHTVSRGLIDPGPFANATGTAQHVLPTIEPWEIVWASGYNDRFPDAVITGLLQQVGPVGADMWGGEPLVSGAL